MGSRLSWRRLLCLLVGHSARVSFWSVPTNGYRCARCKELVDFEEDGRDE